PDITNASNKMQKDARKRRELKSIRLPPKFSLDELCKRLNGYDLSKKPDLQALADVMVMLCMRPAEVTKLRINAYGVTGFVKNRGESGAPRKLRAVLKNED